MNEHEITLEAKEAADGETAETAAEEKQNTLHNIGVISSKLRKKVTPLTAALLAVVLILAVISGVQSYRVGVMSEKLEDLEGVHRAIYDMSQQVVLAGPSDRISLYNYSLGEIAIPALEGVPVSVYKEENFVMNGNGFMEYYDGGELCSYVGVDVSGHNGDIDWEQVKASGVDFVMLRIGGRGYGTEGVLYEDTFFRQNLREAKAAGLWVGAYFFSQAISAEEAREEAQYALSVLSGVELDYPLAFDWEIIDGETARTDGVSPRTLTDCARAFCDTVKDAGYTPCLYTGGTLAYYKYDLSQLSDIDVWYAYYNETPDMYYNYMIWQYSSTGQVPGIQGDVDLNICLKNYK